MITIDKINTDVTAYWFAMVLLFIALGIYGRTAIEWMLVEMYAFLFKKHLSTYKKIYKLFTTR